MATTPYPFVANAILTASQLNSTFNIPVSTKTASYTLVASDAGTRINMNSASATTITVNTSLFSANDNLEITNISTGVCTITAGTATVSTSGTLALAANAGGTLYFISAGVSVFIASGVAASSSAFTCVKAQTTQSGASRVELDDIFSATYRNYLIIIEQSAGANVLNMQMNASGTPVTTSTYNYQFIQAVSTGVVSGRTAAASSGQINGNSTTKSYTVLQVFAPFIAQATIYRADVYIDNNDLAQPFIQNRIGNQQGSTSFTGIDIVSTTSFDSTITCYGYGISL